MMRTMEDLVHLSTYELYDIYRESGGINTYFDIRESVVYAAAREPEKYADVDVEDTFHNMLVHLCYLYTTPLEIMVNRANADVQHTEVGMCYAMNRMSMQTPEGANKTLRAALKGEFNDKTEDDLREDFGVAPLYKGY